MMVKSAQPGEGGGARPPFHSIYHHDQSCGVRSSEMADAFLLFLLYPLYVADTTYTLMQCVIERGDCGVL
jgi:hypothetical protein